MNLKSFLSSLFTGSQLNGELDQIRESARADARLVVGTYVEEFGREASNLLSEHCQQFKDPEEGNGAWPQIEEPEFAFADLQQSTKVELMRLAKQRGLPCTYKTTKTKFIEMLAAT